MVSTMSDSAAHEMVNSRLSRFERPWHGRGILLRLPLFARARVLARQGHELSFKLG